MVDSGNVQATKAMARRFVTVPSMQLISLNTSHQTLTNRSRNPYFYLATVTDRSQNLILCSEKETFPETYARRSTSTILHMSNDVQPFSCDIYTVPL